MPAKTLKGRRNGSSRGRFHCFRRCKTRYLFVYVSCTLAILVGLSILRSKRSKLLVVILTRQRPKSCIRLFNSLLLADYGRDIVDILIHIDGVEGHEDPRMHEHTIKFAQSMIWPHGEKFVEIEKEKIGLRRSWLSVSTRFTHTHVAIFEDDMEVSSHFYNFFKYVHTSNYFSRSTALCLHPSDWELNVIEERECKTYEEPNVIFYFTPERCNWGPIWSSTAWRHFKRWAFELETRGAQPLTPIEIGFNYNEYLKMGKDVQSSWVWRYNWETSQVQLRYTKTCFGGPTVPSYHMAVNHREPGNNFVFHAAREYHDYLKSLLATESLVNFTGKGRKYWPVEFHGYSEIAPRLPKPSTAS